MEINGVLQQPNGLADAFSNEVAPELSIGEILAFEESCHACKKLVKDSVWTRIASQEGWKPPTNTQDVRGFVLEQLRLRGLSNHLATIQLQVPPQSSSSELIAWVKARDTLKVWERISTDAPRVEKGDTLEKAQAQAARFAPWIEKNKKWVERIAWLHLSGRQLTYLPPEIGCFKGLTALELDRNHLFSLPPELGHLQNLQILKVEDNRLTTLPEQIGNLNALSYLSLKGNALKSLPPELGDLKNLEVLALHANQLHSLPEEIGNLTHLTDISLHHNPFTSLPPHLARCGQLQALYLDESDIPLLPHNEKLLATVDAG